jgi:hypothetical protein
MYLHACILSTNVHFVYIGMYVPRYMHFDYFFYLMLATNISVFQCFSNNLIKTKCMHFVYVHTFVYLFYQMFAD